VTSSLQPGRTAFDQAPETARGRATHRAARAADGLAPSQLREQLDALKRGSVLWRLQVSCLRYCSFVHLHHHAEDVEFFLELRATNPAIGSVIDRLQAEHRRVALDLDAVEAAANSLQREETEHARQAVVEALRALERNLLAHLDFEERSLEATVRRMRDWSEGAWAPGTISGTRQ
jgi:hemerythrin-like domain-containing protein